MGMGRFRKNFEALRDRGCNCLFLQLAQITQIAATGVLIRSEESRYNVTYLKNAFNACDFDCTDSKILSVGGAVPNR